VAALALIPNVSGTGGLVASATVAPTSGYAGAKLVATFSFTPKSSCSAYHQHVSWSFGNTENWATSPAPSTTGTECTSSTPSIAPPSGVSPGAYKVCGMDMSVSSNAACTTYTIKASTPTPARSPSPSPKPTPGASPLPSQSPSPSPSPTSSPAPGTIGGTHSPDASPGAPPPAGTDGEPNAFQPTGNTGEIRGWPWIALVALLVLITAAWRFRSWLVGVFENVEVLGRSGADLESELLHHESSSPAIDEDAQSPTES
jgi:hypothetical protein